ncbi:MAG TPA: hypothetical protein VGM78_09945, partial [Ilumatobacteraceae bacterium]
LDEIASVTDQLFLDTHYCAVADDVVDGHPVGSFREGGYDDVLSGLSPTSLWMTLPEIESILRGHGFEITNCHNHPDWGGQGPRVILSAIRPSAAR